jgi:hypothetical protein
LARICVSGARRHRQTPLSVEDFPVGGVLLSLGQEVRLMRKALRWMFLGG